jgi:hypothetical protein
MAKVCIRNIDLAQTKARVGGLNQVEPPAPDKAMPKVNSRSDNAETHYCDQPWAQYARHPDPPNSIRAGIVEFRSEHGEVVQLAQVLEAGPGDSPYTVTVPHHVVENCDLLSPVSHCLHPACSSRLRLDPVSRYETKP